MDAGAGAGQRPGPSGWNCLGGLVGKEQRAVSVLFPFSILKAQPSTSTQRHPPTPDITSSPFLLSIAHHSKHRTDAMDYVEQRMAQEAQRAAA